jgi:hypothetical protein
MMVSRSAVSSADTSPGETMANANATEFTKPRTMTAPSMKLSLTIIILKCNYAPLAELILATAFRNATVRYWKYWCGFCAMSG